MATDMIVLSCGTVDLSERILRFAGIEDCFGLIEGNRFQFDARSNCGNAASTSGSG